MTPAFGIPKPRQFEELPWGLWHLTLYFGIWGLIGLLFLILAPLDIGSFEIGTESMTGPEFIRRPEICGWIGGALPAAAAAFGVLTRRAWARPLLLLPFPLLGTVWLLTPAFSALQSLGAFALGAGVWRYAYYAKGPDVFFGREPDVL